ncbi:HNH endonuclease signature motif containing protein [Brevibacterium ihuae]|uniref:HNH endonuclease signature motif containing protein n=1 Tax=Brevibacterium ihuae TaxID=1631743 RepID=UPI0015E0F80D|nr:HNH endonuclease signature motif containing protein [Brevibacterium ihuae]
MQEGPERTELVAEVRRAAARIAQCQAGFIALLDRIEQERAWEGWVGIRSFAHWVAYACEMTPHTAREYIRVARGLRELPEVARLFGEGRVSYSKVREITRLAGRIDADEAARMCRYATSAQLSRMVSTYRRIAPDPEQDVRSLPGDVLRVEPLPGDRARIVIELPEPEAAELLALVEAAVDRTVRAGAGEAGAESDGDGEQVAPAEPISRVDRLLDLVRRGARSPGEGGATSRRAEVYVHAAVGTVAAAGSGAEGTGPKAAKPVTERAGAEELTVDAAAGTRATVEVPEGEGPVGEAPDTAYIEGYGPVSAAVVGRMVCSAPLVGALLDGSGDVLALGRTRRLASHRQRRALAIRDVGCQFPGCSRTRLLEAHHIRPWSAGGSTDVDGMLLLCRSHHIAVHEHAVVITRAVPSSPPSMDAACAAPSASAVPSASAAARRFVFTVDGADLMPEPSAGSDVAVFDSAWFRWSDAYRIRSGERSAGTLQQASENQGPDAVEPDRIRTLGGGEGFDLGECVRWIFDAARLLAEGQAEGEAEGHIEGHVEEGEAAHRAA